MQNHDPRFQMSAIRERYNNLKWFGETDKWHQFTANSIAYEISKFFDEVSPDPDCLILNAGAGGNDFGLLNTKVINLDISETRISRMINPVVASVEQIPLANESVDYIVCVGSVINYCDAAAVIAEFSRVIRKSGVLILEFESSFSAELMIQSAYGQASAIAETFYAGQSEAVWVYAPRYITNLLSAAEFDIRRRVPIHILSPWGLLFLRRAKLAAAIAPLDRAVRKIPFLSRWASNYLLFCEKKI